MKIVEITEEMLANALHRVECPNTACRDTDPHHPLEWVGTPEKLAREVFVEIQRLKFSFPIEKE